MTHPSFETHISDSLAPPLLVKTSVASIWRILHTYIKISGSVRHWCWQRDPSVPILNKTIFFQNWQKIADCQLKQNVNKRFTPVPAEPPLSLPVPYGHMPRTWASPRPSCPMVQLIICSATRKLMLAYASLCFITAGCQGQNCSKSGCVTDWFGIRGLGLD